MDFGRSGGVIICSGLTAARGFIESAVRIAQAGNFPPLNQWPPGGPAPLCDIRHPRFGSPVADTTAMP